MSADAEPNDNDLAARAAAGEEPSFTQLMRRHKAGVYKLIRRYVGNNEDAYDLVQESFVAAWLALNRYDHNRPFAAWLRRIALNKCRDWSRRRAVRSWFTRSEPLDDRLALSVVDSNPSPEAALTDRQSLERLDRAIASLPRGLKEALLLTSVEGLTHEEAGGLLGLSPKAVEIRVYRARRAIADRLAIASRSEKEA